MSERPDALAEEIRRLAERIDTLQADVRRLSSPALPPAAPGWGDDDQPPPISYAWLGALESPVRRRSAAPRLVLEILFLAACAVAAGIAELDPVGLAGVMIGAWVLVALIEWASSRADRRRDELLSIAPPYPVAAEPAADPSWYVPPVEQTMLDAAAGAGDSATAVTRLPSPADAGEETVVQRADAR
jgi:hypothetical protein